MMTMLRLSALLLLLVPASSAFVVSSTTNTKFPWQLGVEVLKENRPLMRLSSSAISVPTTTRPVYSAPPAEEASSPEKSNALLTASLVKTLVGGTALTLPACFASLGGGGGGESAIPVGLAVLAASAFGYSNTFGMLGKVCEQTKSTSYTEAWEKTMGHDSAWIVSTILTIKTALSCLATCMILGDAVAGMSGIPRTEALSLISVGALLPLCCALPDLKSLAPFSLAGVLCMVFTMFSMLERKLDGSYDNNNNNNNNDSFILSMGGGDSVLDASDLVTTATGSSALAAGSDLLDLSDPSSSFHVVAAVKLACTLATAFVGHYNAPRLFQELNSDERSFGKVTKNAYAIAASMMAAVALIGYLTFGDESLPVILNNYNNPMDTLMNTSRILFMTSLVLTFPLAFVGLRDAVSAHAPDDMPTEMLSVILLAGLTTVAMSVQDISAVLTVGGGTISTAIASVLPTLMYRQVYKSNQETNNNNAEPVGALLQMGLSVGIGLAGVTLALQNLGG